MKKDMSVLSFLKKCPGCQAAKMTLTVAINGAFFTCHDRKSCGHTVDVSEQLLGTGRKR